MVVFEFGFPFQWWPTIKKHGPGKRFMWGLIAIWYVPNLDLGELIVLSAKAGIVLQEELPQLQLTQDELLRLNRLNLTND